MEVPDLNKSEVGKRILAMDTTIPPNDRIRAVAEEDTGFFARFILNFDFHKDDKTGERKTGPAQGVQLSGPHKEMTDFLDAPHLRKHMEAPRGALKTSVVQAYCMRRLMADRNLRIMYGMETYDQAKDKLNDMKVWFEENKNIKALWGDVRGKPWSATKFTLSGRTGTVAGPSIWPFGVDKAFTGYHCDILVLDDLVSFKNITETGMKNVMACFKMVAPLLDPGGTLIIVGTRYHDEDLYGHILANLREHYEVLILDCGMDLDQNEHGEWSLVGKPIFNHLTESFLRVKLAEMTERGSPADFCSQYLNKCMSEGFQLFKRRHFLRARWDESMRNLNCYMVTDTATSEQEDGCHSVVGLVGLDSRRDFFLLDLRVGHWDPKTFVDNFFDVIEKWQTKIPIRGQLMENYAANRVFRSMLEREATKRQIMLNLIEIPRGSGEPGKKQRIKALQGPFCNHQFHVVDTVPPTFQDLGRTRLLWDPVGHRSDKGDILPDGELVRQFIRFPVYGKNDIADALADVVAQDRMGEYYCKGMSIRQQQRRRSFEEKRGSRIYVPMDINGVRKLVDIVPTSEGKSAGSWWQQADERIGGSS